MSHPVGNPRPASQSHLGRAAPQRCVGGPSLFRHRRSSGRRNPSIPLNVADEFQWWLEDHARPIFIVLGVALVVVAYLAFTGPRGGEGQVDLSADQILTYDAQATDALKDAQTALDAYATAHGGSYEGATPADVEASIPEDAAVSDVTVQATPDSVSITLTSGSGGAFTITRTSGALLTYSCSSPGLGACGTNSTWN
jgi:hypothetical protein